MTPESLSDKLAQLLFVRIGSNMRPSISVEEDVDRVESLLQACPIGGLVVFNGTADISPDSLSHLQGLSRYPLLVSTDMERGLGQQFRGATVFPHAFAFDNLGEEAEAAIEESAFIAASEALAAGVHISFSPVADVHSNPDNPIISIRSFGSTPRDVAVRAAAYVRGCKKAGLLTTAKHFPGHGDTSSDSHDEIPVVSKSRSDLDRTELPPFQSLFDNGVDLVMTAHVAYPNLDPSGTVATRSFPILTDLLREKMAFGGTVITDSLLMEGAESSGSSWAAEMLMAGVDILLDVQDPVRVHRDLLRAVSGGALRVERVDEAFLKVWALKEYFHNRWGPDFFTEPEKFHSRAVIGSQGHLDKSKDIASKAIVVERRDTGKRTVDPERLRSKGLLFVLVRPHVTYSDPTAGSLAEPVHAAFEKVTFKEVVPDTTPLELRAIVEEAVQYGAVVIAASIKPAAWHRFGLLPEQEVFIKEILKQCPGIIAAMGSPRLLDVFPEAPIGICTFSDVSVSQHALVDTLVRMFSSDSQLPGEGKKN